MPRTKAARARKAVDLTPRVKVWLEAKGRYGFGLGISEILQAIEQFGSIKRASNELGKSYRYVWSRVKEAEKAIGRPLVETMVGGRGAQRSFLTQTARQLVADFLAMRSRMIQVMDDEFRQRFQYNKSNT